MHADEVCGRWVHVREEDSEGEMILRSADSELPPARGRAAIELRPDGTYAESGLGATDAPEDATGSWQLAGDTITLSAGATQGVPRELVVVAAHQDRLVIRRTGGVG